MDKTAFKSRSRQVRRMCGAVLGRALTGPRVVSLEITHLCNLCCVFCESHGRLKRVSITERSTHTSGQQMMDLVTARRLVSELAHVGVDMVELSGKGEPLAHPDHIEIIQAVKQAGMACSLVTNGTLARRGLASALVELDLDCLNVSLNAGTAETHQWISGYGLWDKAISLLQDVLSYKHAAGHRQPWVRVSHVICRDNWDDFSNMVRICLDLGVDEVVWNVMGELPETVHLRLTPDDVARLLIDIPEWRSRLDQAGVVHNLSELAAHLPLRSGEATTQENPLQRQVPCYEGWFFCVVGPDGLVFPCCYCEDEILGSIHEQSFAQIWYGAAYRRFRANALALPRTARPICKECFTTCNKAAQNLRIFKRSQPHRRGANPLPRATV